MHPDLSRIGEWYHGYVKLVDEPDLSEAWLPHTHAFLKFFENIPEEKQVISNPNQINGKEVSTEATGKYNYKAIGKLFTEWYTKVLSRHQS